MKMYLLTLGLKHLDSLAKRDYAPYSKMAKNILFFCLYVNWPLLPRFKPKILLNSVDAIEAMRAFNMKTKE